MVILYIVLALLVAFLAVILIRTLRFTPKEKPLTDVPPVSFDRDRAVSNLQQLIRCRTVSSYNPEEEDDAEFEKLIGLLPQLYPHVFATCEFSRLSGRGLLFHWKGRGTGEPAVLMAHYDVVPVEEQNWEKPPFEGIIENGVLWGRGTIDTKVTFSGILTAADHLIGTGFVPENDIYFAFSGGEEVNGQGAIHIVDWFEEHHITPAFVLDEGGAVVENIFPGVSQPCGMVGIAEKGMLNLTLEVASAGGHASAPKPHTPIGVLSKACCAVEAHPFPYHLSEPVRQMFDTLGRYSTFVYRMIFANLWCFGGILDGICKKSGGQINALMRTTVAFTKMQGSKAINVIPPVASMSANLRLNPEDSIESATAYVRGLVRDPAITVTPSGGMEPSRVSTTDCAGWQKVKSAVASTWQGCIVAPYLMVQCSDSRHYGRISDRVYRFSAQDMTAEEMNSIHGNNERIRTESIAHTAEFYIRLISQC